MNIWLVEIWRAWRANLHRPGFLLLATGVVALGIGASVALAVSRLLAHASTSLAMSLLRRSGVFDPAVLVGVCVLLALSGLLACLLPALRAGRVQPMRALRGE